MDDLILKKMRADFDMVARARKTDGEWSDDDIKEFSAAIRTATESNDATAVALWARWLSDLATGVVYFTMVVRAAETAMRAKSDAVKAASAGGR